MIFQIIAALKRLLSQVSWVRVRDSHILSVASTVFISDERFRVVTPEDNTEWNLRIK